MSFSNPASVPGSLLAVALVVVGAPREDGVNALAWGLGACAGDDDVGGAVRALDGRTGGRLMS